LAVSEEDRQDIEDTKLTFGEHLEELRARIFYSLFAVIGCFFLCYAFKVQLLTIVKRPHDLTMAELGLPSELRIIRYQEGFLTLLKISFFAAVVVSSPIIIYQIWRFVSVGLYKHERRHCVIFGPVSLVSFILGVLFGYFFLIPLGLQFLLSVLGPEVRPQITMSEYVGFVALLTLILGVLFELPLVMLFLSKIGVMDSAGFAKHRKPAILVAFIVGAVLTPPDPFTQILMAIPILGLYEIGILVSGPTKENFVRFGKLVGFACLLIVGLLGWGQFHATGQLVASEGDVSVRSFSALKALGIGPSDRSVRAGSLVTTKENGKAEFHLADGSIVKTNSGTSVRMSGRGQLQLFRGELFVRPADAETEVVVRTANGEVTARGATFMTRVNGGTTTVTVIQGTAEIVYQGIRKTIAAGHRDSIVTGGIPVEDMEEVTAWTREWGGGGPQSTPSIQHPTPNIQGPTSKAERREANVDRN